VAAMNVWACKQVKMNKGWQEATQATPKTQRRQILRTEETISLKFRWFANGDTPQGFNATSVLLCRAFPCKIVARF
jgi:hypothetical protein